MARPKPSGPSSSVGTNGIRDLASWIEALLLRELESLERELGLFGNEEMIWRVAPGVSNSSGTLALHVCGNLQHYVGAILGASGYVRDRDLEFTRRGVPRAALLSEIHRTRDVVHRVLSGLSPDRLLLEYPEEVRGCRLPTGLFLLHLGSHLAHHLGQIGYLRRIVTGEAVSSGAISVGSLSSSR